MALKFDDPSIVFDVTKGMILEASAGSGKTTILTERWIASFLYLLIWEQKSVSESLRSITALTFTRKAAMEMKVRIRERLTEFWENEEEAKSLIENLAQFYGSCQEEWTETWTKLTVLKDDIDDLLSAATITTINAYVLNQLRSHPIELGQDIKSSPEDSKNDLSANEKDAQTITFRNFLENKYPESQNFFTLSVQLLSMKHWRKFFEEIRSLVSKFGEETIEISLKNSQYFSGLLKFENDLTLSMIYDHLKPSINEMTRSLEAEQTKKSLPSKNQALLDQLKNISEDNLIVLFSGILRKKYELSPVKKDEELNEIRHNNDRLYKEFSVKLYQVIIPMIWEISKICSKELKKIRDEHGEISFGDSEILFLEALKKDVFRSKIQSSLRFFFADEYQDTSNIQKSIFDLIMADPKIIPFFVGDPKQSIYRFRQANVYVFDETAQEFVERGYEHKFLNTNYRSANSHVNLVNYLFDRVFDNDYAKISYRPQNPHSSKEGKFSWTKALESDDEKIPVAQKRQQIYSDALTVLDQKLQAGVPAGKIMVLFQGNAAILEFHRMIKEYAPHLPVSSSTKETIWNNKTIKPLLSFLKVLVNPHHNLTVIELLKSPLFACSDIKINEWLFEAKKKSTSLFTLLESKEFEVLREFILLSDRMPLEELLALLIRELEYESLLLQWTGTMESLSTLNLFVEEARLAQEKRNTGLGEFLDLIEEESLKPDEATSTAQEDETLQLMTVHSSKGLEADHVIFVMNYAEGRRIDFPLYYKNRIAFSTFGQTPLAEELTELEKNEELSEQKRVAYVAITRAKLDFTLCGVPTEFSKSGKNSTQWSNFLNQEMLESHPIYSQNLLELEEISDQAVQEEKTINYQEYYDRYDELNKKDKGFQELPQYLSVSLLLDAEFNEDRFYDKYLRHQFDLVESLRELGEEEFEIQSPSQMDIGNLVHEVLQQFEMPAEDEVRSYLEIHHEDKKEVFYQVLDLAFSYWNSEFYQELYHNSVSQDKERQVTVLLPNDIMIRATADLYVSQKDQHVIVDYKLSIGKNIERYERQLSYYALLSERSGYPVDSLILYSLKEAKAYPLKWDREETERLFEQSVAKATAFLQEKGEVWTFKESLF